MYYDQLIESIKSLLINRCSRLMEIVFEEVSNSAWRKEQTSY